MKTKTAKINPKHQNKTYLKQKIPKVLVFFYCYYSNEHDLAFVSNHQVLTNLNHGKQCGVEGASSPELRCHLCNFLNSKYIKNTISYNKRRRRDNLIKIRSFIRSDNIEFVGADQRSYYNQIVQEMT